MEDNDYSFLRKRALKDEKCIMSDVRDCDTKCYCMAGKLLFSFPATLDRLRMSSQVFSNKFIAV